jgi:hypothetical protein
LYKIERVVEIKGAGGASVFAISKRFNSFSDFFYTKSREQLKSKLAEIECDTAKTQYRKI